MRNTIRAFLLAAAPLCAAAGTNSPMPAAANAAPAAAAKTESKCPVTPKVGATMDIYSAYVWHGMVVNKNPVWQPDGALTLDGGDYGALAGDVWMNNDLTKDNGHSKAGGVNEMDFTAQYNVTLFDHLGLGAGHIWYQFPNTDSPGTREFFGAVSIPNDYVVPFVKSYYDYDEVSGSYSTAGLSKDVPLTDKLTAGASAWVGLVNRTYSEAYYGEESKSGLQDGDVMAYLSYAVTENISVGGRVGWMSVLDDSLRDGDMKNEIFWGGINLGVSY